MVISAVMVAQDLHVAAIEVIEPIAGVPRTCDDYPGVVSDRQTSLPNCDVVARAVQHGEGDQTESKERHVDEVTEIR